MDSNAKGMAECKNPNLESSTSGKSTHIEVYSSRKPTKRGEIPVGSPPSPGNPPDPGNSKSWVCKNSACKAVLSLDDAFCKRCSCCICHQFDDNKDPTLWLVCGSESSDLDSCGLSCHVECAIQHRKAGVASLGDSLQIDGSYCCASCGKVSGILGFWKKQLVIARDARRVDILCYRISLSYLLLDGTCHFKALHEVVSEAKAKLETEVGPVGGVSANMARGIVSRLSVAGAVQKLCSMAIGRVDEWLTQGTSSLRWDSLPAACRFYFEDVTSSTVVIVLKDTSSAEKNIIKGYKLWYGKSREREETEMTPVIFPKDQKRILVSNLQPCTEYTFKIISFTELSGDVGHSESRCFTRSVELILRRDEGPDGGPPKPRTRREVSSKRRPSSVSDGFRVRDLGKILRLAWAQERGGPEGNWADSGDGGLEGEHHSNPSSTVSSCGLNLNVLSVLGMNPELLASFGCSDTSDNNRNGGSSEDSQNWATALAGSSGEETHKPDDDDLDDDVVMMARKRQRAANDNAENGDSAEYDGDSTLVNGSPPRRTTLCGGRLDERYEECVKMVRWLECNGHVGRDFRMKFLTWYSLRSTEQERRVVHTFVDTLIDDPSSLAGQLLDSFSGIVSCNRPWDAGSSSELCATAAAAADL